jgi:hypothetical protein
VQVSRTSNWREHRLQPWRSETFKFSADYAATLRDHDIPLPFPQHDT